jgi:peptidyl-prolyl cis-trans isomerase A (cyclophilin A)
MLLLAVLLLATPALARKTHPALLDPSLATEQAPDEYSVKLVTTAGPMILDVHRSWAPLGADRFYNLVKIGYYDNASIFRVIVRFVAQFGVHGDPAVASAWKEAVIPDDPPTHANEAGTVTFAMAGPGSRTTQVFINLWDNPRLDGMGFAPFGKLRDMKAAEKIHVGYGEGAPTGRGPDQTRLMDEGEAYLAAFPKLTRIKRARLIAP